MAYTSFRHCLHLIFLSFITSPSIFILERTSLLPHLCTYPLPTSTLPTSLFALASSYFNVWYLTTLHLIIHRRPLFIAPCAYQLALMTLPVRSIRFIPAPVRLYTIIYEQRRHMDCIICIYVLCRPGTALHAMSSLSSKRDASSEMTRRVLLSRDRVAWASRRILPT